MPTAPAGGFTTAGVTCTFSVGNDEGVAEGGTNPGGGFATETGIFTVCGAAKDSGEVGGVGFVNATGLPATGLV
ncbi:MAG: hypothetical protein SNJ84_07150 [Verrucomicrobiia bacterium]